VVRSCSRTAVPSGCHSTCSKWQQEDLPSLRAAVLPAAHSAILLTNLTGNLVVMAGRSTKQDASVKQGEAEQSTLGIVIHTYINLHYLILEKRVSEILVSHCPFNPLQSPFTIPTYPSSSAGNRARPLIFRLSRRVMNARGDNSNFTTDSS